MENENKQKNLEEKARFLYSAFNGIKNLNELKNDLDYVKNANTMYYSAIRIPNNELKNSAISALAKSNYALLETCSELISAIDSIYPVITEIGAILLNDKNQK